MDLSFITTWATNAVNFFRRRKSAREKNTRRLRRIRQDVERCGELAHEILETKLTAPAHRMPVDAWASVGGDLMDDGVFSEGEYRLINLLFDLARQSNLAVDEAAKGLHNPTPAAGALLSRPLIKAQHILDGNPSPYDNALASIARALDPLA